MEPSLQLAAESAVDGWQALCLDGAIVSSPGPVTTAAYKLRRALLLLTCLGWQEGQDAP